MAKKLIKKAQFGKKLGKFLTGPLGGAVPQLIGKMMGPKKPKSNSMQSRAGAQPVNMSGMQQSNSDMMKKGGAVKKKAKMGSKITKKK